MNEEIEVDPEAARRHEREVFAHVADLLVMLQEVLVEYGIFGAAIPHIMGAYATAAWTPRPMDPAAMNALLMNAMSAAHGHRDD